MKRYGAGYLMKQYGVGYPGWGSRKFVEAWYATDRGLMIAERFQDELPWQVWEIAKKEWEHEAAS